MSLLWMRHSLGFITLSLCLSSVGSAQCVTGNCQDGKGTYLYPSGAKYIGQFEDYLANGFGTLFFANGDIYEGEWKAHRREGKGKFTSKGQFVYEGHFRDNQFEGEGVMTYSNDDMYKGEFKDGLYHGDGVYTTSSGQQIPGPWVRGETSNMSKPSDDENSIGSIEDDVLSANYKNCNSEVCHEEEGRFVYEDGTTFTGMFVSGEPNGPGKVVYPNGDVYRGGWKNHAPHGEGVVNYTNGRSYGALWSNGKPIKELAASRPMIKETVEVDKSEENKIWAVVIGVSRYNHMPTLKYTDDDAYHLYAFLKSPEGGALPESQITLLIDEQANRKDIIRGLQQTFYKADENDVVLLYFSGHGLEGRLIPSDFDGYNNAVRYDEIKEIVEQSNAQHKIVIADACHSGSMLTARSTFHHQLSNFYQQLADAQDGVAFISSSKGEEVSLESSGLRHGVFSHFLIEGLRGAADTNNDGTVTISELYVFISEEVKNYTEEAQHPLIFGAYDPQMPISFVRD